MSNQPVATYPVMLPDGTIVFAENLFVVNTTSQPTKTKGK